MGRRAQRCIVEWEGVRCGRPLKREFGSIRRWCPAHSARWYRHGDVQAWKPIGYRVGHGAFIIPVGPLRAYLRRLDAPISGALSQAHARMIYHSRRRGGFITLWSADAIACSLGRHPVEIWGDWYELTERKETA